MVHSMEQPARVDLDHLGALRQAEADLQAQLDHARAATEMELAAAYAAEIKRSKITEAVGMPLESWLTRLADPNAWYRPTPGELPGIPFEQAARQLGATVAEIKVMVAEGRLTSRVVPGTDVNRIVKNARWKAVLARGFHPAGVDGTDRLAAAAARERELTEELAAARSHLDEAVKEAKERGATWAAIAEAVATLPLETIRSRATDPHAKRRAAYTPPPGLTRAQAAAALRTNRSQILRMVEDGRLTEIEIAGRKNRRIADDDLYRAQLARAAAKAQPDPA